MAIRWSPKCNTTAAIMAVGGGNAAGAAAGAAGAAAGMFLGIMMATEAQREQRSASQLSRQRGPISAATASISARNILSLESGRHAE
jgi:membrane protease subunit (stomatin/prohibitin family)